MKSSFSAPIVVLAIIAAGAAGVIVGKSNRFGSSVPSAISAGMSASAASDDKASGVASNGDSKRVKYYRNPMGLSDKSAAPKKDNMGMDYLPVYEGDDGDDASVKFSPGKIQKAGGRSEPVEMRILSIPLRAPGTVQEDERRKSVACFRFEGVIDAVEDVTTGRHVKKGEPLMRLYGPGLSSAAAEY